MGKGPQAGRGRVGLGMAQTYSLEARGVQSRCAWGSFLCPLTCGRVNPLLPPLCLCHLLSPRRACPVPSGLGPYLGHTRKHSISKRGRFLRSRGPCEDREPGRGLSGAGAKSRSHLGAGPGGSGSMVRRGRTLGAWTVGTGSGSRGRGWGPRTSESSGPPCEPRVRGTAVPLTLSRLSEMTGSWGGHCGVTTRSFLHGLPAPSWSLMPSCCPGDAGGARKNLWPVRASHQ